MPAASRGGAGGVGDGRRRRASKARRAGAAAEGRRPNGARRSATAALAAQEEEALGAAAMSAARRRAKPADARPRAARAASSKRVGARRRVEVEEDDEALHRGRSTARTSGCSSAATGRRSTPSSTSPTAIAFRGPRAASAVVVDAAGYRERRAEAAASRTPTTPPTRRCATGSPVALDAMTAVERRVVHEYLRDRDDVETYSEGEEPDRHLVVAPEHAQDVDAARISCKVCGVSRETFGATRPPSSTPCARALRAWRTRRRAAARTAASAGGGPARADRGARARGGGRRPSRRLAGRAWSCPSVRGAAAIADLGAGAGFPGLALAVALPGRDGDARREQRAQVRVHRAAARRGRARRTSRSSRRAPRRGQDGHRALRRRDRPRAGAARRVARVRGAAAARGRRAGGVEGAARRRGGADRRAPRPPSSAWRSRRWSRVSPYEGAAHRHLHVLRKVAPTPDALPAPAGDGDETPAAEQGEPARRSDAADATDASVRSVDGHRLRDREPEGRRRQDDDRRERRRLHRRGGLRDAAGRRRPAGERHASGSGLPKDADARLYDVLAGEATLDDALRRHDDRAPRARPCQRRTWPARTSSCRASRAPRGGCARRWRRCASASRSRSARLPAVARAADRQRARRGRPRDRAGPDRVLRARGARGPARHAAR